MRRGSRVAKPYVRPQAESLEPRCLLAALIHDSDLAYLGAFRLPGGTFGASSFDYGGTALAYNPANNGLFMVGHDWQQAVAEVNIPALKTGSISGLNTASVRQNFENVLEGLNAGIDPGESLKIGGLMVHDNKLMGTAYVFYDADGDQQGSHFTLSSLDLSSATKTGLHQVGTMGGGWVGGWMTHVPAAWQGELGTSYLTGNGALSIISRTSWGPSAFGFDPAQVGPAAAPASSLLHYPQNEPLAEFEGQNDWFNGATEIRGIAFPEGSDSVLFIGSHGTGPVCYGDGAPCGDPLRSEKGYHAYPYRYQVWAYDAHDLAAVKNGQVQPWEVQPYGVWELDLPYSGGGVHIGGVAYDAANNRIYVTQLQADEWGLPIVHGFQIRPVADIDIVSPELRNTPVGALSVHFSENVTGVDLTDFQLLRSGTPVSLDGVPFSGSGATYVLDLSSVSEVDGNYVLTLRASASGISDTLGADFATDVSVGWTIDTTEPTADIVDVTPDPRNGPVGVVTIKFSEDVTGIDRTDFTLTRNGTSVDLSSAAFSGGGASYTLNLANVTATEGSYVLTITAGGSGIADLAGNPLETNVSESWVTDATAPLADIVDINPNPRNNVVGLVTITFSENVTGVDRGDFSLTRNGMAVNITSVPFTGSGSSYTLDLSDVTGSEGTYALILTAAGSGIVDAAGNALSANATDNWLTDTTAPTADIVDISPDPRTSAVGLVTITLSESVTGVDRGDFTLTWNGLTVNIGNVPFAGSGSNYTLNLTDVTGNEGTYVLTLTASGSGIQDLAGNPLGADAADTWITDATAPTADIVDISPDPRKSAVSLVTITFSESVTGVDRSDFTLTRSGTVVNVGSVPFAGSGSNYTLDLTAVTGSAGTYVLTLTASGSGIVDAAGNAFSDVVPEEWLMLYAWHNYDLPLDVSRNGKISTFDAALIVNELNGRQYSDPVSGALPAWNEPTPPPYLFDVSQDNRVSVFDAALVVNYLNWTASQPAAEGEARPQTGFLVADAPAATSPSPAAALLASPMTEVRVAASPMASSRKLQARSTHIDQAQRRSVEWLPSDHKRQRTTSATEARLSRREGANVGDELLELLASDVARANSRRRRSRD